MSDIEDADFEELPSRRLPAKQPKPANSSVGSDIAGAIQSRLDPKPQGFLERLNPSRAFDRVIAETHKAAAITQARRRLVEEDSRLKATLHENRSVEELAELRVQTQLERQRLALLELRAKQAAVLNPPPTPAPEPEDTQEVRALREEVAKEGLNLKLQQLRLNRAKVQQEEQALSRPPEPEPEVSSEEMGALLDRMANVRDLTLTAKRLRSQVELLKASGAYSDDEAQQELRELRNAIRFALQQAQAQQEGYE